MAIEATLAGLGRSKVFRGLDRAGLERIFERGKTATLATGEVAIAEGAPNADLFVVIDGELSVFLPQTPERFSKVRLGKLGPGDCIGEYSFIDDHPASATVSASRPTQLFRISQTDFEDVLESDRDVGRTVYRNLLRLLITRLRENNRMLDLFRPIAVR